MSSNQEPLSQEFDSYKDSYNSEITSALSFSGQSHEFFIRVKADYILDILKTEPSNGPLEVLDIGCGHGLIHPYLVNQKAVPLKLTGVDPASSVVEVARKNNPSVAYKAYDGVTLPYADGSFAVAVAMGVMHHVPPAQWRSFVQEVKRVLKPNGLALIFEHNPYNPLTQKVVRSCEIDKNAVLLRPGKLRGIFKDAGFRNVEGKFILFTPFDRPFFRRLDRGLGWLPLGAQYYVCARS